MDLLAHEIEQQQQHGDSDPATAESFAGISKIIDDITITIDRNKPFQDIVASYKGWYLKFLLVLYRLSRLQGSTSPQSSQSQAICALEDNLYTVISTLLSIALSGAGGWHVVEDAFLYARGVWNWQRTSEIDPGSGEQDAWRGVCLRIAYQLMEFITLIVSAEAPRGEDATAVWANFVNLAGMVEAIMFTEPTPPPSSALLLKKLSPAAAAALESAWPNFGPGYLRVRKGEDGTEQWTDFVLALKTLRIYDMLWAYEEVKTCAAVTLETVYGRKRAAATVFLRISLAVLFYMKQFFLGGSSNSGSGEDEGGQKAKTKAKKERQQMAVYREVCMNDAGRIIDLIGVITKAGGNANALLLVWALCAILEALHKTKLSADGNESEKMLFAIIQQAGVLSQSAVESAIPSLKPVETVSAPQPTLQPQSKENSLEGNSSTAATNAEPTEENNTTNEITNNDRDKAFDKVFAHINEKFEVFIGCWIAEFYGVSESKARAAVASIKKLVTDVEKKEFSRQHAAGQAKADGQAKNLGEEVVKTSGARRVAQDSTAKDLARYEERMRLLAGERQSFLAFQAQDARRVAWKAVRRIVRAVAHAEGCWDYKTGRALYAATPLTEEEEEEEDKLIRCHIQESDEDKCEQGGEGKDSAGNVGDNNDGDEEYPLWKVDSFVRDDVFIRPFVRVDYSGDLNPRRKDFDSVTGNNNNNNNSVKPTTGREEKDDEEEEEKEGKEGKEEIVMPTVGEEFISVIRCERVSFARRIPGTLCFTARRLFFFAAGDRDGSHGFKAWPLEALRRLFVHHFALVHGLKVLAGSRLYLFEAEARGECLKFAKTLAAAAAERGALRGTGALVADPVRALRKEGWTERWVRGELSNFQYLMVLNTYGGRMFGDMSRYPVFPWVLTDYAGASAGLGSPEAFRDLAKPVGALNEKRLQDFLQRYHVMQRDRMVGAMLPFMYGSHYSTQGSTMFWLMCTEPVASACRDLQGGHFDHPDRLFFSVETAWSNSLTNTSDVKELVPEFFFFPEFLRNANRYWFGHMQSGLLVDDVLLPPWACGSPELFVRFCAEALESPYASAHLHQWIDLIFGASQTGKAAEAANNVFYYLTYPKDVDKAVAATKDSPVEAQAIRTQLTYFGQCPTHLFLKPHPPRKTPSQQQQQQQKKAVIAGPMPPTSISVETLPMPIRGKKKKAAGSLGSGCGVAPLMTAVLQGGSASDADASVVVVEATHEVTLIDPFLLRKSGGKDGAWTLPYSARPPLCYCTHLLRPAHIIAATLAGTSFFVAPLAHQKVTAVAEVVNAVGYGDEVTALALNRPGASCGSLLAVGGHKGLCTIWSLDSHRCLSSVAAVTMAAAAAATSTGSGSGSGNGIVGSVDVDSGSSSVGIIDGNNNDCFDDDDDDNNDNNGGGGVGNNSNSNGEKKTQGNESGGGDAMAIPNVTEENLLVPSQRGPSMILREQHSAVLKVCFSDDSSVCATGAADGTVCLYHIEDGRAWFAAAIHRPPNNASSSNNNNTNNTSEVAALAFTRTRNDLVILWKGDKAVHFATVNGRIYDSVPLSGNNTTNSNSIGGAVDMFVTMRGPCSEYVVVLDKHGIFFISVDLVQLPNARCKAYWALPSPPGSTVTIVGGGQVGKRWAPKTPNYLGPMEDMGGIGGGGGGNSLVSNDAAAALTAVAGSNNSNSSSSTPEPQDSLETIDKDGGNGDENKGSNGESGAVMPKQQQQPIETKLTSGKGGHEVNIFLVCMVTSASPNASGNGTTSCVNTTRQYMIVSI